MFEINFSKTSFKGIATYKSCRSLLFTTVPFKNLTNQG